jgi:hypothetical protein
MWSKIGRAASHAYGDGSPAGRGAVALVQLLKLKGMREPLIKPYRTEGAGVGLVAARLARIAQINLCTL